MTTSVNRQAGAEQRLQELGIQLPSPPEPFGAYVEAVRTGNLLFLSGMLPTEGHAAKFIGRVGAELDVAAAGQAAVATAGDVRDRPKVADGASELLQDVFGKDKSPYRSAYGVASLPLGTPVELEIIFEVE